MHAELQSEQFGMSHQFLKANTADVTESGRYSKPSICVQILLKHLQSAGCRFVGGSGKTDVQNKLVWFKNFGYLLKKAVGYGQNLTRSLEFIHRRHKTVVAGWSGAMTSKVNFTRP